MKPRLPGDSRKQRDQARNAGTWIALVGVLFIVGAFIGLTSLIMPQIFWLTVVVAGFFFFIAFHYFTWGQWLIRYHQRLQDEENSDV